MKKIIILSFFALLTNNINFAIFAASKGKAEVEKVPQSLAEFSLQFDDIIKKNDLSKLNDFFASLSKYKPTKEEVAKKEAIDPYFSIGSMIKGYHENIPLNYNIFVFRDKFTKEIKPVYLKLDKPITVRKLKEYLFNNLKVRYPDLKYNDLNLYDQDRKLENNETIDMREVFLKGKDKFNILFSLDPKIIEATRENDKKIVDEEIKKGNINKQNVGTGETALMVASYKYTPHAELIDLLLKSGADTSIKDKKGLKFSDYVDKISNKKIQKEVLEKIKAKEKNGKELTKKESAK